MQAIQAFDELVGGLADAVEELRMQLEASARADCAVLSVFRVSIGKRSSKSIISFWTSSCWACHGLPRRRPNARRRGEGMLDNLN